MCGVLGWRGVFGPGTWGLSALGLGLRVSRALRGVLDLSLAWSLGFAQGSGFGVWVLSWGSGFGFCHGARGRSHVARGWGFVTGLHGVGFCDRAGGLRFLSWGSGFHGAPGLGLSWGSRGLGWGLR